MSKKKEHSILIIRMSALGDVAMTIPVIYSFARQHPEWQVRILTQPFFTRLFVNAPENISFIIADLKGKHRGVLGLFRLIGEISKYPIDKVADFHNVFRSWMIDLFFILRAIPVEIVHKNRADRKRLTRMKNKTVTGQRSFILRYADVLQRLRLPVDLTFASLFAEKGALASLPPLIPIASDGINIGIAPFARYKTKTYPPHLMEQVVRQLTAKGYMLYLFGSKGAEAAILKEWERKYPLCIALPGLLDLHQELILMSHLDVMLSMDSANMHLASLTNTQVLSIWGSTTTDCGFLGWQQQEANAICLHLPCQPCSISGRAECPLQHFNCMNQITPESICRQIENMLSHKKK